MNRLFYILVFVLLALTFPIVWEYFREGQPFPNALGTVLMIFGLGLSGPFLIFYSILVYQFTEVKGKKILSAVALLVGLCWAIYMVYTSSNGIN